MNAVFLDRDGVVNEAIIRQGRPFPPRSPAELTIQPDTRKQLTRLKASGFVTVVVTNQPDVARGSQTLTAVEEINAEIRRQLPIDHFFVCYHDDNDKCCCRKPAPGLLLQAAAAHGIALASSFMIGDRWKDIAAGNAAGVSSILLGDGYGEPNASINAAAQVSSLEGAVTWILEHRFSL